MDPVETKIAAKRISRWPDTWKADVVKLTPAEREVLATLVALVDVRPADVVAPSR
jgi:hypothetical protein